MGLEAKWSKEREEGKVGELPIGNVVYFHFTQSMWSLKVMAVTSVLCHHANMQSFILEPSKESIISLFAQVQLLEILTDWIKEEVYYLYFTDKTKHL